MRVRWNYIKGLILLIVVGFLFAFSTNRNSIKTPSEIKVIFVGENLLFITDSTVNKLLIQNNRSVTDVPKEILDLNSLETALKSNPMIKTAEVYLTVNGEVRAEIEQRRPIARVKTNASYYIDEDGQFMPVSNNRSARVPLVTGHIYKDDLDNVYRIAKFIDEDDFLKKHITEIVQHKDKTVSLRTRILELEIYLGTLSGLNAKINNLKAFYQKAKKDKTLNNYSKVNLQFEKQVVCTKK